MLKGKSEGQVLKFMEQILVDLKKGVQEIAGDRLIKMVLYGSRARGDYSKDSDTRK